MITDEADPEPASGTEHPSEPETSLCEAYQAQLLRDRYRLLSDTRCRTSTTEAVNVSDFDSVARVLNGYEVSVSLPGVALCRAHQIAYQKHLAGNTCSTVDCSDRGYLNLDKRDQPVLECMHHMKHRIKDEGVGKGAFHIPGDNISIDSSHEPNLKQVKNRKRCNEPLRNKIHSNLKTVTWIFPAWLNS